MVVRIHNTDKWAELKPGEVLKLTGDGFRLIRVQVNCSYPTAFHVVEDDRPVFLAVVQGHETLEFSAGASGEPVHLVATSEGEVWYFTNDGDRDAFHNENAVSFTKIANRRARNPELERMMFKMEQNMTRRMALLEAENAAWRAAMEAKGIDPDTGEVLNERADNEPVAEAGTEGSAAGAGASAAPAGQAAGADGGPDA